MARITVGMGARWGASSAQVRTVEAPSAIARRVDCAARAGWKAPVLLASRCPVEWARAQPKDGTRRAPWWVGSALLPRIYGVWRASSEVRREGRALWVSSLGCDARAGAAWVRQLSKDGAVRGVWGGAAHVAGTRAAGWVRPISVIHDALAYWGRGSRIVTPVVVFIPSPLPPVVTVEIPVRESYWIMNSVQLALVSGVEIPASELRVSIDSRGPHWSWSAQIPFGALPLVKPAGAPVEVIMTLNGVALRLQVEGWSTRSKGALEGVSRTAEISGRSRSAMLSAPSAPAVARRNTSVLSAQQAALQALEVNGVNIGWDVDWRVADWALPSGAWSHTGTAMEAVIRLAESAGGYVQAHSTELALLVLPSYPNAPWAWSSAQADVILPEDVVQVEDIDWVAQARYNAVYVEGYAASGRRDRVLRAGSAGDRLAPQVVDALATDPAMTRARGLAVLAGSGSYERVSLRVPVLPEVGLVTPGKLVEYHAGGVIRRGLARSLNVSWSNPELWQSIELEVRDE